MDKLLDIIICNSLRFPTYDIEVRNKTINNIPTNIFGIFVTVVRSQKLNCWPVDIHGCIGNWNNTFTSMSNKIAYQHLLSCANSATWEDSRRHEFPLPIYRDALTKFKVSFMKKPLLQINPNSGIITTKQEIFSNKKYGLIIQDSNNNRATYLPNVFPSKSWKNIKSDVLHKASSSGTSAKFWAYETVVYEKPIWELFQPNFFQILYSKFFSFIIPNYQTNIPYMVDSNKTVLYDENQDIRNIASIHDLLVLEKYSGLHISDSTKSIIKKNIEMYRTKYLYNQEDMRQASSFLLRVLNTLNIENRTRLNIKNFLISSLHDLEPQFELGEVLIALTNVDTDLNILFKQQEGMYTKIKNKKITQNCIFQYNWESKFLYHLYLKCNKITPSMKKHAVFLYNHIINIINLFDNPQTNYLAVAFESLSSLLPLISTLKIKNNIKNALLYIFTWSISKLVDKYERYKSNGLFYFTDGSARIDITGHFLNGLFVLHHNQ